MKWLATIFSLILIPAFGLAQAKIQSAGVSKEVESRTGHKLNPAAKPSGLSLPEGVSLGEGVTEDEAIAIALWNNPALQAEMTALGLARADVIEAEQLRNPSLTLIFPFGVRILEAVANWPFEALWQRPKRVAAAKLELERVEETLVTRALDLVRDVRLAYADYAIARSRARLIAESVRERAQIAVIFNARFRAGDISELETGAARLDVRLAEEQALRFTHDAELASERLRALLGFADGPAFEFKLPEAVETSDVAQPAVLKTSSATPSAADPSQTLDELIKQAFDARAELKAGELAIEAAGARAKWERSRILTVSALAKEYGRAGSGRFEQGPGLQIEAPIFNRNQGGISRAEAEIERAARQFIATRQRISAEVREAYLSGCAKPQAAENRKAAAPPAKVENAVKESELATVKLSPQAEARLGITTAPVTIERVAQTRTFAGEIVLPPDRTTSVMAPLNGALEASGTPPAVGTFVRKGQPLYHLTPFLAPERDLRVQIEREVVNAQTRVEAARARHKRAEQLLRDGAASEKAVEQAREELDLAGNDLKAARERLERYEKAPVNADVAVTIAAPRDGVIQKVSVNPGQTIASGSPLFEVANLSSVWIRVPVVEAALNALKPGLKDVEIDSTICASSTDYFPLGFDNRARISLTV